MKISFTEAAYARLKRITEMAKVNEVTIVRDAIRFYEWYLGRKADGYQIGLVRKVNGEDRLVKVVDFPGQETVGISDAERGVLQRIPIDGLQDISLGYTNKVVADGLVKRGLLRKEGITYFPRIPS